MRTDAEQPGKADYGGIEALIHCLSVSCCNEDHGHKPLGEERIIWHTPGQSPSPREAKAGTQEGT